MSKKIIIFWLLIIIILGIFLRFYKITSSPPALFVDEADVGYQAYSLLKTGRDYYGNLLPIHVNSFADKRTPLYIYLTIPSILVFGVNEFAVRFPAALFGTLTIPVVFFMFRKIYEKNLNKDLYGLIGAMVITLLPWHIHYSRMAFETTLLLFIFSLGLYFFILWQSKSKSLFLLISIFFLLLTPYVYSTAKLFTPLVIVGLIFISKNSLYILPKKHLLFFIIFSLILILPITLDIITGPGRDRFSVLSVLTDKNAIGEYQHLTWLSGYSDSYFPFTMFSPLTLSKLFLNLFTNNLYQVGSNYLSSFSPQFLIFTGDNNLRHNIPYSGVLGLLFGLLFYYGFLKSMDKNKEYSLKLFLILLFLSPLPAAITKDGMHHATRLFLLILPITFFISIGFVELLKSKINIKLLIIIVISSLLFFQSRDLHLRLAVYPNLSYNEWHWGFKEISSNIKTQKYDQIWVDNINNTPVQTIIAFYQKTDPTNFQYYSKNPDINISDKNVTAKKYFENIYVLNIDPVILDQISNLKILAVVPVSKIDKNVYVNIKILDTVTNPWGDPLYYLITN